ncbi:MAG: DUF1266 domain-containing protein [Deltaproteobacteria bacterium]|nr:DUF1266 domain-containing protein [Deltaproteobacteria bacterium]
MFDPRPLDAILAALEPGRDLGLRPAASEHEVAGLPDDVRALLLWRDGQAPGEPALVLPRNGIVRRLGPQGRLMSAAEIEARARPGFVPLFEHRAADGATHVGLAADGKLRWADGARAVRGAGNLPAWLAGLADAHRALYMIDADAIGRAQRWVMAVPGVLAQRWGAASDTFGMVPTPEHAWSTFVALRDDWGIDSPASATGVLATLRARARDKAPAWNLARLVAIAGWSYRAGLLSLDDAWSQAASAARDLQKVHRGWFSMAEASFVGRDRELGIDYDLRAREDALTALHQAPWSPWNLLPWATPLPEDLPPPGEPERPEVLDVHDADGLRAALHEAPPRSVIRLHPGRYAGHFRARAPGHVIEAVPGVLPSSVVIAATQPEPVLTITGGTRVRGLTIAPDDHGPGIQVEARELPYLRLEDCFFSGGRSGLEVLPSGAPDHELDDPVVELDRCFFERPGDAAIVLSAGLAMARDVEIVGAGGDAIRTDALGHTLVLERSRVERPAGTGITTRDAHVVLRRVVVDGAGRDGLRVAGGRVELDACEILGAARAGLRAIDDAQVDARGSRFADCGTANVELAGTRGATFEQCHLTGGLGRGAYLHPAPGTVMRGGQIGGSVGASLVIDGTPARALGQSEHGDAIGILLDGVGLGPSGGSALTLTHGASLSLVDVTVSGVAGPAVEVTRAHLEALRLRVRNVAGDGLVVGQASRLEARRLECADIGGDALVLCERATATLGGLAVHGALRGLVARDHASAIVKDLVVSRCARALALEGESRVAVAGDLSLGENLPGLVAVRTGAALAVRALRVDARPGAEHDGPVRGVLTIEGGRLHLDGGALRGARALVARGGRVVLARVTVSPDALLLADDTELVVDPTPPAVTALSPLHLPLCPEPLAHWGAPADVATLARLALHLADGLGLAARVAIREAAGGVRIDGPLPAIARLAPALEALFTELGALGLALAEVAQGPR